MQELKLTNTVTKHLLDSLIPITTNIQIKLEKHLEAVLESNKTHEALNEKLQPMQEKLKVTSQKVTTGTKTYSQAASSTPLPPTPPPHNPPHTSQPSDTTLAQIQIRNREEIKSRQVLINFDKNNKLLSGPLFP